MGAAPANVGGFFLSDRTNKPMKWKIPAGAMVPANGFLRIWLSGRDTVVGGTLHYHAGFKLTQTKNEHLVFSNQAGNIINDIEVAKIQVHQSYGRIADGDATWGVFKHPTPGSSNNARPWYQGFADRPDFDVEAGFYADSVKVSITTDEPNAEIHYTLDGSEPKLTSPLYTEPIKVSETKVLKAVTFSMDTTIIRSFSEYATYFINVSHTLPVVSVGAFELLDLANGDNTLRPTGSIEYFGVDKARKARSYGELNSHGQDSWANDQRSLDWVSRDEFGYSSAIKEKLFSLSDRDEYQRIILRAAGDDNYPAAHHPQNAGSAHIRDAYVQNMAKKANLNLDVRIGEKAIVFLNGLYWGVYDLREIPDDHDYTDYYYGQGKYDIQFVLTWGNTWAEYGGQKALTDWALLSAYINTKNMADSTNFKYVDDRYDWRSLIDYVLVNSFSVCSDWLNYNTGWWRGLNPEGGHQKWGYILWDNDATYGHYINYTNIPDTGPTALPCNPETLTNTQSDPKGHIKILKRLMQNPFVKQYYISRQADLINTAYSCENMLAELDSIVAVLTPEMEQHAARWDGTMSEWQANVAQLRNFINTRCKAMDEGIIECYDLEGPYTLTVDVDPPGQGKVKLNTMVIDQYPWTGIYFGGMDNKLEAIPDPNATLPFQSWTSSGGSIFSTKMLDKVQLTASDTIIAHFSLATKVITPTEQPSLAVYPTVVSDQLTVEYYIPEKMPVSLQLFSLTGRAVLDLTPDNNVMAQGGYTLQLDIAQAHLSPGAYFLRFIAGNEQKTVKLMVAAK
jgi:hypothetical protein